MADVGHGVNVFWRYRFFQPEQAERLKLFCYSLCCPRVVAAMHVASEFHLFGNGFAHMLDPAHHPVNLGVVGSPVHPVEAVRIGRIIQVNLHGGETLILDPWKLTVGLRPRGILHIGVAIDPHLVAEFSAQELINGQA